MTVHHIGYLVDNIEQAIETFGLLGYSLACETIFDETRRIYLALISQGKMVIELIQPERDSYLWNLRSRFKNAPYHICYSCADLDLSCQMLRKKGFFPVRKPEPAILFHNRRVCFLFHRQIGFVELLEDG